MKNKNDKFTYHATINSLDASGDIIETYSFSIDERDALIGNMISTPNGYLAFGGVYDVVRDTNYDFANYESKLFFFNNKFELQKTIALKEESKAAITASAYSFVAPHLIHKLPNDNFVLYGPDGLYIINLEGEKLSAIPFTSHKPNSILIKDDYFIVSEFQYLRKYDFQGNMIGEVKHDGISTLGLLAYKDNILFMAYLQRNLGEGATTFSARQLYFGMVDHDLNIINFKNNSSFAPNKQGCFRVLKNKKSSI